MQGQNITKQSNFWYTIHKCCQDHSLTSNRNFQKSFAEQIARKEKGALKQVWCHLAICVHANWFMTPRRSNMRSHCDKDLPFVALTCQWLSDYLLVTFGNDQQMAILWKWEKLRHLISLVSHSYMETSHYQTAILKKKKKWTDFYIHENGKSSCLSLADLFPCPVETFCLAACSWGWWVPPRFPWPHPQCRWESPPGPSPWRSSFSASAWPSPWGVLLEYCCWTRTTSCHWSHCWRFCCRWLILHCLRLQMQKSRFGPLPLSD